MVSCLDWASPYDRSLVVWPLIGNLTVLSYAPLGIGLVGAFRIHWNNPRTIFDVHVMHEPHGLLSASACFFRNSAGMRVRLPARLSSLPGIDKISERLRSTFGDLITLKRSNKTLFPPGSV